MAWPAYPAAAARAAATPFDPPPDSPRPGPLITAGAFRFLLGCPPSRKVAKQSYQRSKTARTGESPVSQSRVMITLRPTTLEINSVRLEPLSVEQAEGLRTAVRDGNLWELWFTAVPAPD